MQEKQQIQNCAVDQKDTKKVFPLTSHKKQIWVFDIFDFVCFSVNYFNLSGIE